MPSLTINLPLPAVFIVLNPVPEVPLIPEVPEVPLIPEVPEVPDDPADLTQIEPLYVNNSLDVVLKYVEPVYSAEPVGFDPA